MNTTMTLMRDLAFSDINNGAATRRFPAGTKVHVVTYKNKPGFELRARGTLMVRKVRAGNVEDYAA